jgi:hypothetical protein
MTVQLDPGSLTYTYTQTAVSDYVNVVDDSSGSNVIVGIANVVNVSYSIAQPGISINVSSDRIWFNGTYTAGNTSSIKWRNPPLGANMSNGIAYNFADVPPGKYVYEVSETNTTGVTITHNFTVNYTAGGNATFSIERFVMPSIYAAYNFLSAYYDNANTANA